MDGIRQHYTAEQIDIMLNLYFRDYPRPTPYPTIALHIGVTNAEGLDDLLWKVITGYGGKTATGPRREYSRTEHRMDRTGWAWQARDDAALRAALAGDGQLRQPPCDFAYIAAVLARSVTEVEARWKEINTDILGRKGFFE